MNNIQVPVGNSFHSTPEVIRGKVQYRSAQRLREDTLTMLYKHRGGELTLKGIAALLGYKPSASATWKINKAIKAMIEEGYVRRVKAGNYSARYYVLKGVPELDSEVTGAVADTPPHEPSEAAAVASFGNVNLASLDELTKLGVQFSLTITSKGFEHETK